MARASATRSRNPHWNRMNQQPPYFSILAQHIYGEDFSYSSEQRDGYVPEGCARVFLDELVAALPVPDGSYSRIVDQPEALTTNDFRGAWRLYLEHERFGAESFSANNPLVVFKHLAAAMESDGYTEGMLQYAVRDGGRLKHCSTIDWKRDRGLLVSTEFGEPDVALVRSLTRGYARRRDDELVDKLVSAGIPESCLAEHRELWECLQNPTQFPVESTNAVFAVQDAHGNPFVLKLHRDAQRAFREARATFHLGELPCIVGSPYRDSFNSEGVYVTVQNALTEERPPSIRYWMHALAAFHTKAPDLLAGAGLSLQPAHLRDAADYLDRHRSLRSLGFSLDHGRLADSIAMLRERQDCIIHNDLIPDNMLGSHMIDLENIGYGSETIDLVLALLAKQVPLPLWATQIDTYARAAGVPASPLLELLEPTTYVVAAREAVNAPLYKPSSVFAKWLWPLLRGECE